MSNDVKFFETPCTVYLENKPLKRWEAPDSSFAFVRARQ